MTIGWRVGVAQNGRSELAEVSLKEVRIEVHFPRSWEREKTLKGKMKLTCELLMPPYFYARFDGDSDDEYSLARSRRGVMHFLESRPGRPGSVLASIIDEHRAREDAERAGLVVQRTGAGRKDLERGVEYRVVRGAFKDRIGKLVDHSRGWAWLDFGGIASPQIADCDIDMAPSELKKRA